MTATPQARVRQTGNPTKPIHSLLGLIALVSSATAATNTTLYETSFEPPAFTPGIPFRGQDNWEMYHDGEAISVSTNNARTGAQCLRFDGFTSANPTMDRKPAASASPVTSPPRF